MSLFKRKHEKLDRIQATLDRILERLTTMPQVSQEDWDDLVAAVAAERGVTDSAVTLLNGLADKVAALNGNTVDIQALASSIRAKAGELSTAVATDGPALGAPTAKPSATPMPPADSPGAVVGSSPRVNPSSTVPPPATKP